LIGERWALLVIRELLLSPKRFKDLRSGLPGISPNILIRRLRDLIAAGVVQRRDMPPPTSHQIYELTALGRELEAVVDSLGRWGLKTWSFSRQLARSKDSDVLFLRLIFDPDAAEDLTADLSLRLNGEEFRAHIADQRLSVTRGGADHPDAVVDTTIPVLYLLLSRAQSLDELLGSGQLYMHGDRQLVARLPELFVYQADM
jgi:DNA-binding HxlR family transcriptional regulator